MIQIPVPAFPVDPEIRLGIQPNVDLQGMSKRFYAACAAMQGILANPDWSKSSDISDDWNEFKDRVCISSFDFADELLKQENL